MTQMPQAWDGFSGCWFAWNLNSLSFAYLRPRNLSCSRTFHSALFYLYVQEGHLLESPITFYIVSVGFSRDDYFSSVRLRRWSQESLDNKLRKERKPVWCGMFWLLATGKSSHWEPVEMIEEVTRVVPPGWWWINSYLPFPEGLLCKSC